jgi:formamidopyrimidine-DNA glycosylase
LRLPELPEVETTCRGIASHLRGRRITGVVVRDGRLRWPVPADLPAVLDGQQVRDVRRRGKYLLVDCTDGTLILHLGMSGSLRVVPRGLPPGPHDHLDIEVGDHALRLRDPRRFGSVHWTVDDPGAHPLLARLGPEPLERGFDGVCLHAAACRRRVTVKALLMDSHVVVGVGNIYANEALFRAGIRPGRRSDRLTREDCRRLVVAVRSVLAQAVEQGGTSLRDFVREDGRPGYFVQELKVYGRGGMPCLACGKTLKETRQGQRTTVYCPRCQR